MTINPSKSAATKSRGSCAWSGVDANDLEPIEVDAVDRFGRKARRRTFWVRPQHREAFMSFSSFAARWARWFLPLLGLCIAIMIGAAAFAGPVGLGVGSVVLGVLMVGLPFATPETVEMLGVRKSVFLVRGMGVAMALAGILFILAPVR